MKVHHVMPLDQRLKEIIDQSVNSLCHQVASGKIQINNEASFQMHLASLMRQIGSLYEHDPFSFFSIELEKKFCNLNTCKSVGTARCDIYVTIKSQGQSASAAVELKYLPKSTSAAVTDERYSVLLDVENVEQYQQQTNCLGYVITLTTNGNHAVHNNSRSLKYDISDGKQLNGVYPNTKNRQLTINNTLTCNWEEFSNNYWLLKLEF